MTDSGHGDGAPDDAGRTFEELIGELEVVTEQLAGGQVGIEQAAELYERAERLHRLARGRLDAVQARVDQVAGDAGSP